MSKNMTTGHVYRIADGAFGVVVYFPQTEVRVAIVPGVSNEYDACRELARERAGRFVVADSDTRKWGETLYRARGYALML